MAGFWIIGGGRFGRKACEKLRLLHPAESLLVVDRDQEALAAAVRLGAETVCLDGLDFLTENLAPDSGPDWIIPCAPFHLAYRWLMRRLGGRAETIPVPPEFAACLPHPLPADDGGFYMSHADFLCPDDCPEPANICTHTGQPRPGTLFRDLAETNWPGFTMLVQRSHQMAPGLGGYRPADLFALEESVLSTGGHFLLATACRCHGVLHALKSPAR